MFLSLFRLLIISFVFHYYKNRYPKEYQDYSSQLFDKIQNSDMLKPILPYILKFGYALIYIYSFFQILLNKVISKCLPYVKLAKDKTSEYLVNHNIISERVFANVSNKSNNTDENNIKSIISFYNEGTLITMQESDLSFKDLNQTDIKGYEPQLDYDLLLILDKIKSNDEDISKNNILTFMDKNIPTEFCYELSNIRFIALYLKYDDKTYSIDLYDNNNNYVIGNVLNSAFYKYYLTNVLNIIINNNKPFLYELELMDHNVSMICLNEKQSIIIEKDDYKIITKEDPVITKEDSVITKEDPVITKEDSVITKEDPVITKEDPVISEKVTAEITDIVSNVINDEFILCEDIKENWSNIIGVI